MKKVKCECGQIFTPSGRGKAQIYCSTKCRMRAYRKRVAATRNVTIDPAAQETIALLRKDNARLRRLLAEAQAQLPEPKVTFPIKVAVGRWLKIKSTTSLRPGAVIRLLDDEQADHLVLEKDGRTLRTQSLRDGTIGTLSIYDAKANWKLNSRASVPRLLQQWEERAKS